MKLRVMGTKEECQAIAEMFQADRQNKALAYLEISGLYPNRAPSKLYRIYIDVLYTDSKLLPKAE